MAARVAGCCPVIAVDRVSARLRLAGELGATHCVDSEREPVARTITGICGGLDYAFDTTGDARMLAALRKALNAGASACGVGIGGALALSAAERRDGKTWATPDAGFSVPQVFIPRLIGYYRDGAFPFDRMLRFYPFADIGKAFRASLAHTAIKPVVLMDETISN
jgi:aryl-alcohol dehydrogenase